ncbi:MAG: hypothetical protein IJR13_09195 [Bacteroidales bacterium]|nr:hypothetical protein [Bacteroidales bacterium]
MKKILPLLFVAFVMLTVASCGKDNDTAAEQGNSTALVHKAFIVEQPKEAKGALDTVITYAISFLDANSVLVERVFAELVDGVSEVQGILASVADYRFDGTTGSFSAVMGGESHQFAFSMTDERTLTLTVDGYRLDVRPTDFVAGQTAGNVLSSTSWKIDQQAVEMAAERYGNQVAGLEFTLSFAEDGATGSIYLNHPMMSLLGDIDHNIPMEYDYAQSTVVALPYGRIVLDSTSQLGGALASVHADMEAHYVVINAQTMVLHLNVGNAAPLLQVPTSDVYLPLRCVALNMDYYCK